MPREKSPFENLIPYLPDGSYEMVMPYILEFRVQLTLTRERKTILGNYRSPFNSQGHRISVNANLNKYSFLITLLHELAHLFTWEKYKNKVSAHGKEWKIEYSSILKNFVAAHLFPKTVEQALLKSLHNPAASSCGDEHLLRALKTFDTAKSNLVFVEQLDAGDFFKTGDGRKFIMIEKLRKRYKCKEVASSKMYLFNGLYEVEPIS